jgi:hypothetical protein
MICSSVNLLLLMSPGRTYSWNSPKLGSLRAWACRADRDIVALRYFVASRVWTRCKRGRRVREPGDHTAV